MVLTTYSTNSFEWSGQALIHTNTEANATSSLQIFDIDNRDLNISFDYADESAYREVSIYCPIWILNKTGERLLVADSSGVETAGQYDMEVQFHFTILTNLVG
jgi:hypothetical protein